jgi:hypothetical protein
MQRIHSVSGREIDVDKRSSIDRNDIEAHKALFQRDVEGLAARNADRLREICESRKIAIESFLEMQKALVELFASESHYRRRNKLRNQVTSG